MGDHDFYEPTGSRVRYKVIAFKDTGRKHSKRYDDRESAEVGLKATCEYGGFSRAVLSIERIREYKVLDRPGGKELRNARKRDVSKLKVWSRSV